MEEVIYASQRASKTCLLWLVRALEPVVITNLHLSSREMIFLHPHSYNSSYYFKSVTLRFAPSNLEKARPEPVARTHFQIECAHLPRYNENIRPTFHAQPLNSVSTPSLPEPTSSQQWDGKLNVAKVLLEHPQQSKKSERYPPLKI